MRISDQAILEFIALYEEEGGRKLSAAEAEVAAAKLILLYELIYQKPLGGT